MNQRYLFSFISCSILVLFFCIMLYVIGIAYLRHSGSTGLDMATIQKIRFDSLPKKSNPPIPPRKP